MKVSHLSKLSVHHSDNLAAKYDVSEKEFPPGLLAKFTHFNGSPIQWITNFGFRHKPTGPSVAGHLEESYDIELDPSPNPGAQLVYFDGTAVHALATQPSDTTPGKIKATLTLGDPPIGWT
jgi:hypothetical protein